MVQCMSLAQLLLQQHNASAASFDTVLHVSVCTGAFQVLLVHQDTFFSPGSLRSAGLLYLETCSIVLQGLQHTIEIAA